MEYNQKQYKEVNVSQVIKYCFVWFFLNRIISTDIFYGVELLNEIFVMISKILTALYVLKWVWYYYKKQHLCINEMGCIFVILIYFLLMTIITVFNDGNIRRIFMDAYPIIGTLCFIDMESKRNSKSLIKSFMYFLNGMVLWNFIDMLFVKRVLFNRTTYFLISGRNQLAIVLVLAFTSFIANSEINKTSLNRKYKIINLAIYFIILATAVLSGSATTLIGTVLIYILYILKFAKQKNIIFNPITVMIGYAVAWLGLVVFRLQYLLSNLIVDKLHKDLTLSHRTLIWDVALEIIQKKPLFGYGMSDSVNVFYVNHDYTGRNNNIINILSAHNQILQILYYGGIALLCVFILLYFVCCFKKESNNIFFLFFLNVIVILIIWLSEVPSEYSMFLSLGLCYYSARFEKGYNG